VFVIVELVLVWFGLKALFGGRTRVFGRVIEGWAARLVGLLAAGPFFVVATRGFIQGYNSSRAGRAFHFEDYKDLAVLEMTLYAVCLSLVVVLAVVAGRAPSKPVNPEEEWKRLRACGPAEGGVRLRSEDFLPPSAAYRRRE
jgi:hypothetical protein